MYKEVAFDPQCLCEFHYYALLKSQFGFEHGRYVVAPLKPWVQEAVKSIKGSSLSPVKQKSIKTYLNRLQRTKQDNPCILLPKDRASVTKAVQDWLGWVESQQRHRQFNSVVSERPVNCAIDYEQILLPAEQWNVPPSLLVDKTKQDIVKAVSPLIHLSSGLTIVDQYFSISNNPVLKGLIEQLQNHQQIGSLTLVTSVKPADPHKVFQHEFVNQFAYLPAFKLIIAPERYFHDRYMITDVATIKAGHGFSTGVAKGGQSDKLSLSLCGKAESDLTLDFVNKLAQDRPEQVYQLN